VRLLSNPASSRIVILAFRDLRIALGANRANAVFLTQPTLSEIGGRVLS
jgi:hypothetical protein